MTDDDLDGLKGDERIVAEAKNRFKICQDWESITRPLEKDDYKFANADCDNMYQWTTDIYNSRIGEGKPCLTINKTQVHNLQIINDAKQNKPGITIRPTGDGATYEAAQIYQDVVRHIEYISSAENVYDDATTWQVETGIGYFRICTEYASPNSFDQEIYIRRVKNPHSVYLDPDINQLDGSDARFGFIFEDVPRDLFMAEYPDFKDDAGREVLGNDTEYGWIKENTVRVAEYYRKTQKKDKLVSFIYPGTEVPIQARYNELTADQKEQYKLVKKAQTSKERDILEDKIEWFKIAGNKIIEKTDWPGIYIPICRVIGVETIIDGQLIRKGHTRALKDPQRMYNYASSNAVEFAALQTKSPWIAPVAAIEGLEDYWKDANTSNLSMLPYNHVNEDSGEIPAPQRIQPPQQSVAYVQGMQIAQNEMMMASGQFQAQLGENENAKSGVAINARQRQGDRATYHFIDNLAIAIRYAGRILIDLIPKIYDTERIIHIRGVDGTSKNVKIDPNAETAHQRQPPDPNADPMDNEARIPTIIFNPNVGTYAVQSDVGPGYATKREQAFNALTQIASQNKDFMMIGGDLLFKEADFPTAPILAERYQRAIPPNILGQQPDPKMEEALNMASNKIQQMEQILADLTKQLADKDKEIDIRSYEAETKRVVALGNSGPAITPEQIQGLIHSTLSSMLSQPSPTDDGMQNQPQQMPDEVPPEQGARQAPDGNYYVSDPDRPGKYLRLEGMSG